MILKQLHMYITGDRRSLPPTGFLKNEEVSDMNKTAGPQTDAAMGRNV